MTRAELQKAIHVCAPSLSRAEAKKMLEHFFEEVTEALVWDEHVELRSFGNFKVRSNASALGAIPRRERRLRSPRAKF